MTEVFLIAGEPSGDALGAEIIAALRKSTPGPVHFVGVGGALMRAAGMEVLLPAQELAVMGIAEGALHLPRLHRLGRGLQDEIARRAPAALVTIDFPDFNFAVASGLRKRAPGLPMVHVVAPTVWAWRPGRARAIARFLDGLVCLLPFEPPYFEKHGLPALFAGHPVMAAQPEADGPGFRAAYEIPAAAKVLGLLPGSRRGEVARCGRALAEAAVFLAEQVPGLQVVVPTLPEREYEVVAMLADLGLEATVVADPARKWDAFAAMDAAIAVSGTVGLELAAAGVPHVTTYRASAATYWAARALVRTKYAHLANIVLDRALVPELLQKRCEGEALAAAAAPLLTDPEAAQAQKDGFAELRARFATPRAPADMAAAFIWKSAARGSPTPRR